MSDTLETGVTFTPEEEKYFDSGGTEQPPEKQEQAEQTEQTEQPKPEPEKQPEADKVEKVVPLAALHEERGKRKTTEARLREIEIENAKYAERFKILERASEPQKPAINEDPVGYLQTVPGELESVKQKLAEREQRDQYEQQRSQVLTSYANDAAKFKASKPEWDDAYKFVVEGRVREYELIGHPNPLQAAQEDEFGIVVSAMQQGRSPAEVLFSLAEARGFKAKQPEKTAAEKLETIEKGQNANRSLSSTGGGGGGADEMTAERLLKMPLDEFEEWVNKNPAKSKRLMGG